LNRLVTTQAGLWFIVYWKKFSKTEPQLYVDIKHSPFQSHATIPFNSSLNMCLLYRTQSATLENLLATGEFGADTSVGGGDEEPCVPDVTPEQVWRHQLAILFSFLSLLYFFSTKECAIVGNDVMLTYL
jgi:hypothetical protein